MVDDEGVDALMDFEEIVKDFQTFFRLNVTGELDEETLDLMSKPRCANADKVLETISENSI